MLLAITGDGVFAAIVGIGHGMPELDADRGPAAPIDDEGGRCGCVAGDAFADGGFDVAVAELCPGEGPAVAVWGGATYVVAGATVVTCCCCCCCC